MSDLVKKTSGAGELMELASVAELLVKSSYCGVKKPEDALWIIATGHSLGIDPITSLRGIHVISGKPVLSADLMSAVAMRHPDCLHLQVVEMTPEHAVVSVQRRGWPKATSVSFSIDDARAAGLLNNPTWKKYPADMCKARALARAARIAFPDALLGIYVEGELEEPAQAAPIPRSPEAAARVIEEAELVEDEPAPDIPEDLGGYGAPIDYSKEMDWEAANRSYRQLIGELKWSKVDEQRVHEWVKRTAQVQSSKEIDPQRLFRLCERLKAFDVEGRAEWLRNAIEKRGQ